MDYSPCNLDGRDCRKAHVELRCVMEEDVVGDDMMGEDVVEKHVMGEDEVRGAWCVMGDR